MKKIKQYLLFVSVILVFLVAANAQTGFLPADLDAAFGPAGSGIAPYSTSGFVKGLAVLPNDNFIVNHNWTLSLHTPNGATQQIAACPFTSYGCGAMAILPNGFVIAAGRTNNGELGITRFDPNLNPDPTFGTNGIAIYRINSSLFNYASSIVVQGNQLIIVGFDGYNGLDAKQFVGRLNFDGTPDLTFGNGGFVEEPLVGLQATSVALQKNDIVVAGQLIQNGQGFGTITVYDGKGRRSNSFNQGNIFSFTGNAAQVVVQPDRKIVFSGLILPGVGKSGIGRLNPNGNFDRAFGQNGTVTILDVASIWNYSLALDPFGRIVFAGQCDTFPANTRSAIVARFTTNGQLDQSFTNSSGPAQPFGWRAFVLDSGLGGLFNGIGFQSNGKIIVGAQTSGNYGVATNAIYRFNGN
jgi:uncharacterized delta-60 repeat protein